jgi:hypothetical protein
MVETFGSSVGAPKKRILRSNIRGSAGMRMIVGQLGNGKLAA